MGSCIELLEVKFWGIHHRFMQWVVVLFVFMKYVCCDYYRILYKRHVKGFIDTLKDIWNSLSLETATEDETEMICTTCANSLSNDKIPSQALSNSLTVIEIHQTLRKLCNLEKQLFSKTIQFMKIYSLPKIYQHDMRSQVVSVPANVLSTTDALPRNTQSAQIVALNLKRYSQTYKYSTRNTLDPN